MVIVWGRVFRTREVPLQCAFALLRRSRRLLHAPSSIGVLITLRPYMPLEPRYPHLRWDAGAPASVRRVSTRRASARRASLRRASVRPCVAAAALLIDGLLQRARRPDVHHTLRGELVLMAHRLLCDSTLGSRVLKKKEEDTMREGRVLRGWALGMRKTGTWFRDWGLRVRMSL